MSDKRKPNGHRTYILTIEYNNKTSEIVNIQEEFAETNSSFYYGDIALEDYWDKEAIDLMSQMDDIGVS